MLIHIDQTCRFMDVKTAEKHRSDAIPSTLEEELNTQKGKKKYFNKISKIQRIYVMSVYVRQREYYQKHLKTLMRKWNRQLSRSRNSRRTRRSKLRCRGRRSLQQRRVVTAAAGWCTSAASSLISDRNISGVRD